MEFSLKGICEMLSIMLNTQAEEGFLLHISGYNTFPIPMNFSSEQSRAVNYKIWQRNSSN